MQIKIFWLMHSNIDRLVEFEISHKCNTIIFWWLHIVILCSATAFMSELKKYKKIFFS